MQATKQLIIAVYAVYASEFRQIPAMKHQSLGHENWTFVGFLKRLDP